MISKKKLKKKQLDRCITIMYYSKMATHNTYIVNEDNTLSVNGKKEPIIKASKCARDLELCYDNWVPNRPLEDSDDEFDREQYLKTKCNIEFFQPSHLFGKQRMTQVIVPAGTWMMLPFGGLDNTFGKLADLGIVGNIMESNNNKYFARSCHNGLYYWPQRRMEPFGKVYTSKEAAQMHNCV